MSFLQLASWNIEHLSGQPRAKRRQSAYALADHIEMAGVDLIALQEIYLTPEAEEVRMFENQEPVASRAINGRRNSDLDIVCYLLEEHLETPWKYVILPNRKAGDSTQLCAVMWNSERFPTEPRIHPLDVEHKVGSVSLWDRKPHLLEFTSPKTVWRRKEDGQWEKISESKTISLVPLHMKSNFGSSTEGRMTRAEEAKTLCMALERIKQSNPPPDPSLVLLGDTNVLRFDEPAIETFIEHGFVDLNNTDAVTYWSKQYQSPFDRFFVAKGRPEFKYSRQYVLRSSDLLQHDQFLSDHYMIKMSVKDYVDDADPRESDRA